MNTNKIIPPPIPVQEELLVIPGSVALLEFQASFINEYCHLPEVSLRYLIYLILSDADKEEIKRFCLQVRIDLNQERLDRLRDSARNIALLGG